MLTLDVEITESVCHLTWLPGKSLHKAFASKALSSVVQLCIQTRRHSGVMLVVFLLKIENCREAKGKDETSSK